LVSKNGKAGGSKAPQNKPRQYKNKTHFPGGGLTPGGRPGGFFLFPPQVPQSQKRPLDRWRKAPHCSFAVVPKPPPLSHPRPVVMPPRVPPPPHPARPVPVFNHSFPRVFFSFSMDPKLKPFPTVGCFFPLAPPPPPPGGLAPWKKAPPPFFPPPPPPPHASRPPPPPPCRGAFSLGPVPPPWGPRPSFAPPPPPPSLGFPRACALLWGGWPPPLPPPLFQLAFGVVPGGQLPPPPRLQGRARKMVPGGFSQSLGLAPGGKKKHGPRGAGPRRKRRGLFFGPLSPPWGTIDPRGGSGIRRPRGPGPAPPPPPPPSRAPPPAGGGGEGGREKLPFPPPGAHCFQANAPPRVGFSGSAGPLRWRKRSSLRVGGGLCRVGRGAPHSKKVCFRPRGRAPRGEKKPGFFPAPTPRGAPPWIKARAPAAKTPPPVFPPPPRLCPLLVWGTPTTGGAPPLPPTAPLAHAISSGPLGLALGSGTLSG